MQFDGCREEYCPRVITRPLPNVPTLREAERNLDDLWEYVEHHYKPTVPMLLAQAKMKQQLQTEIRQEAGLQQLAVSCRKANQRC